MSTSLPLAASAAPGSTFQPVLEPILGPVRQVFRRQDLHAFVRPSNPTGLYLLDAGTGNLFFVTVSTVVPADELALRRELELSLREAEQ